MLKMDLFLILMLQDFSIGAVLPQVQDGQEKAIAYARKSLTKSERNYCVTCRELFVVVSL